MDKMLVVVFDNETQAYEGARALNELHEEGSIAVYATAVVAKDQDGNVAVKQAADQGPIGTAVGMFTGSLIGLIAGPVGAALGATTGALLGTISDLNHTGVGLEFVDDVSKELVPGKAALIAEIAESWVTPLDTRMSEIGGTVLRRYRADVVDEQLDREIAASEAELTQLREELQQTGADAKANIQAKIAATSDKLEAFAEQATEKVEALKGEATAKIQSLKGQASKTSADLKVRYEQRAAEVKQDYDERVAKLHKAHELTKEALVG